MNEHQEPEAMPEEDSSAESQKRREFLVGIGKWSGASTIAAVGGVAWISSSPNAMAGSWINRRTGGGWINGGGGGWINRRGGVGWINRR